MTEKAVSRLSRAEHSSRSILANLDGTIKRTTKSGKHAESCTARDLDELVKRATQLDIFTELEGRKYKQLSNFQKDRLENLNATSVYEWFNMHKKFMTWGIRAR